MSGSGRSHWRCQIAATSASLGRVVSATTSDSPAGSATIVVIVGVANVGPLGQQAQQPRRGAPRLVNPAPPPPDGGRAGPQPGRQPRWSHPEPLPQRPNTGSVPAHPPLSHGWILYGSVYGVQGMNGMMGRWQ